MLKQQQKNIIEINVEHQKNKKAFRCLDCNRYARNPVVTRCGHNFCWSCLYTKVKQTQCCPYCRQVCMLDQCYPIYTDFHQDSNQSSPNSQKQLSPLILYQIPVRPAAKQRQKIMNPNMIGGGLPLASNNLPNNVNMGVIVVGSVFNSSIGVNMFNQIEEGQQNDEDYQQGQKFKLKMHLLIVLTLLIIIYSLL